MKTFNVFFLLIAFTLLTASEKPQLARLHYDGGGDWYNDSDFKNL